MPGGSLRVPVKSNAFASASSAQGPFDCCITTGMEFSDSLRTHFTG